MPTTRQQLSARYITNRFEQKTKLKWVQKAAQAFGNVYGVYVEKHIWIRYATIANYQVRLVRQTDLESNRKNKCIEIQDRVWDTDLKYIYIYIKQLAKLETTNQASALTAVTCCPSHKKRNHRRVA
jgi:hypothetical protein